MHCSSLKRWRRPRSHGNCYELSASQACIRTSTNIWQLLTFPLWDVVAQWCSLLAVKVLYPSSMTFFSVRSLIYSTVISPVHSSAVKSCQMLVLRKFEWLYSLQAHHWAQFNEILLIIMAPFFYIVFRRVILSLTALLPVHRPDLRKGYEIGMLTLT